jgi:hypothetical protein
MDAHHPELRSMFTREYLLNADWYHERLKIKQLRDIELWKRHLSNLQTFMDDVHFADEAERLGIADRLHTATERLRQVQQDDYLHSLVGTLGADPLGPPGTRAETHVVHWSKMITSFSKDKMLEPELEPSQDQKIPSLLQRFKARFQRSRVQ